MSCDHYPQSHNITTHRENLLKMFVWPQGPQMLRSLQHVAHFWDTPLETGELCQHLCRFFFIKLKCYQSHLLQLSSAGKSTLLLARPQHLAWPGTWSSCADAAANVKGIYPERWLLLATLRVQTHGMRHAKAKPTLTKSVPESNRFDLRGYL